MKYTAALACFCAAIFACAVPASAQQTAQATQEGITVAASASVTPSAYVEEIQFVRKRAGDESTTPNPSVALQAIEALRHALASIGAPAGAVVAASPFVATPSMLPLPQSGVGTVAVATVRLPTGLVAAAMQALAPAHWTPGSLPAQLLPADEEALQSQALAQAVEIARHRAEALAAADGRRIGKLLNATPAPLDLVSGLLQTLKPLTAMLGGGGYALTVQAGGVFTFELLP